MSLLDDIWNKAPQSWRDFADTAVAENKAKVETKWTELEAHVTDVVQWTIQDEHDLDASRRLFDEYRQLGGKWAPQIEAQLVDLETRHAYVAAGVMRGATKVQSTELGWAQAVVIGAVAIILTLAGACFAVAAYQYCSSLRDEVRLQREDLQARVESMRTGKPLAPTSIVPQVPKPDDVAKNVGYGILGLFLIVGLAIGAPMLAKRG